MTESVRLAIEAADPEALRALVTGDPQLAHALVAWGPDNKNVVPPLHFVCDAVFRGLATQEAGLAMAEVLLDAGVNADLAYAKNGDTFLIAAASLGAELVGLRIVESGADVHARGLFGATALHWAANCGLPRLVRALAKAGSDVEGRDAKYDCTPLEWCINAWKTDPRVERNGLAAVAAELVGLGAKVPASAGEELSAPDATPLRAALNLEWR